MVLLTILAVVFLVLGLDDLHIDLQAWLRRLRPRHVSDKEWESIRLKREQPLAIMVANWKEEDVIARMVAGNLASVDYRQYVIFLGVYPNDLPTLEEARKVAALHPDRVQVVVNSRPGPTNRGQMLNEIVAGIRRHEATRGFRFAGAIIHDSEDMIHPRSLRLYNWYLPAFDFLQVPVFQIDPAKKDWVKGSYADEFAESHTKDMLVRARLDRCIPSAGVSTCLSARLLDVYGRAYDGRLSPRSTLTEDYELGLNTSRLGLSSAFICRTFDRPDGTREFVATREHFPGRVRQAIRQKTRWTLGIAFQGAENLRWSGSLTHRYFLFRDRKGPWANLLTAGALALSLGSLALTWLWPELAAQLVGQPLTQAALWINLAFMGNRVFQRARATHQVYGWRLVPGVPLRILVSNVINAAASFQAVRQYALSKWRGIAPAWSKTQHELPAHFGVQPSTTPGGAA